MKVFVTGVSGQLGFDVMNELKKHGHDAVGSDIIETQESDFIQLDITDENAVKSALNAVDPTR